ncbi:hypothetical protein NS44R_15125, partial [Mammaliicoccus sciuri]
VLFRQQADHDRRRQRGAVADQGIRQDAPQAPADRPGQCGRAAQHHRTTRARGYRDRDQRHRGRGAVDAARKSLRLRRARPAPARHERFRGAGSDPQGRNALQNSRCRVYRPGTFGRGRCGTAHDGAQHRRERRGVPGASARRNVTVPAPCDHGMARRKTEDAGEAQ